MIWKLIDFIEKSVIHDHFFVESVHLRQSKRRQKDETSGIRSIKNKRKHTQKFPFSSKSISSSKLWLEIPEICKNNPRLTTDGSRRKNKNIS